MKEDAKGGAVCLITFSNNADHQNVVYSMFNALYPQYDIYTIGIKNPKSLIAANTDRNLYVDCPLRPGIERDTFNLRALKQVRDFIYKNKIRYIHFESLHIWNVFVMLMCRKLTKIEAIHDVIPHDGNKGMYLCNFFTSHLANKIILRNKKYKEKLAKMYHINIEKINCMDLWRSYPQEQLLKNTNKFLYFGRIRNYKGIEHLERIIEMTPDINYYVVGEADSQTKPIVERLKKLANATVVDREVTDEEMRYFFKESDWIVLPYKDATQSGVIVDACTESRPVIAFNVGAISEQVINGKTGFLIEEGNVEAFAEKIENVVKMSNDEKSIFAHNAYIFGYERYSAEAVANKFINIIFDNSKG